MRGRSSIEARGAGFGGRIAVALGKRLFRFGAQEFEIHHTHTGFLILEVNCVTSMLETYGLSQNPVMREVVDFAQRLRNKALPEIVERGIIGLTEFDEMVLPKAREGGDIIEKYFTYEYAGKQEGPNLWQTKIPQLWLRRDTSDPIDLPRSILGSLRLGLGPSSIR